MAAGLAIQQTVERPDNIPLGPGAAFAVVGAYAAAAFAARAAPDHAPRRLTRRRIGSRGARRAADPCRDRRRRSVPQRVAGRADAQGPALRARRGDRTGGAGGPLRIGEADRSASSGASPSSSARRLRSSCRAGRWRSRSRFASGAIAAGSRTVAFHPTCHLEIHEEHAYDAVARARPKARRRPAPPHHARRPRGDPRARGCAAPRASTTRARRSPARLATSSSRRPPGRASGTSPSTSTAHGCGRRSRSTAVPTRRSPRCSTASTSRSTRVSARTGGRCAGRGRGHRRRGAGLAAAPRRQPRDDASVRRRRPRGARRAPRAEACVPDGMRARLRRPWRGRRARGRAEPAADAAVSPPACVATTTGWSMRRSSIAEERKVFLFGDPSPTTSPSWQRHEVHVGEVTLALEPDELPTSSPRSSPAQPADQPENSSFSACSISSARDGGDRSISTICSAAGSPLAP